MQIVSWNSKGLGSKKEEVSLHDLIKIEKLNLLLVQETKLRAKETQET